MLSLLFLCAAAAGPAPANPPPILSVWHVTDA
jgi:hypothetical protein